MKSLVLFFLSSFVFAGTVALSVQDFQKNDLFQHTRVQSVERVFSDELILEDLYKVTYLVEGECGSAGEVDACELVEFCEYVWVDAVKYDDEYFMEGTQKDCSVDIEDVIEPQLIDEL